MSIRISTAGISISYAVEDSAGTMPTTASAYTKIPEVKEIPEINAEPSTLETTTLEETEFKTYIPGLKDLGGALGFTVNFTEDFKTAWETMVAAYETGKAASKETWYVIQIPNISESVYFKGEPSSLGFGGAAVDEVAETTAYITPTSAPTWAAKPTVVSA